MNVLYRFKFKVTKVYHSTRHVLKTPNTTIPVFKHPSPEHAIRVNPQTQELQET